MRGLIPLGVMFYLTGCMAYSDGSFQQIGGLPIDYEILDSLVENTATQDDVLKLLGTPTSSSAMADGVLQLTYVSVRQRMSVGNFFGMVDEHSAQTIKEEIILIFKDGRLLEKKESYSIKTN